MIEMGKVMKLVIEFSDSVNSCVLAGMVVLLAVVLVSPWELVTVCRVADFVTVVPLEVSVHAVKTLELKTTVIKNEISKIKLTRRMPVDSQLDFSSDL